MTRKVGGAELVSLLYNELRKLAAARIRRLRPGHILEPDALVHEAYLRLARHNREGWNGRGHFFGAAALAMRDILVEHARREASMKRGGDLIRTDITHDVPQEEEDQSTFEERITLHNALDELQQQHPSEAEIVLLRYFAGLSLDEVADVSDRSRSTVQRQWRFAQAWLRSRLKEGA